MKLPFEILDTDRRHARVTMRAPLMSGGAAKHQEASTASRHLRVPPESGTTNAGQDLPNAAMAAEAGVPASIVPRDDDYIYPLFRALSQTVIEGYWIDYSRPGVLEESTPLLAGQTVYADHHFWNVEKWLGVVNDSQWDAEGAQSDGVPGINVELKIDALLNPRIARGLLMQPPAIHSASVTVLFEYEYSHPDLIEEGRFWDLLGEEVSGELVRLIATKILSYWELSLVFQGADRGAKQLPPRTGGSGAEQFAAPTSTRSLGPPFLSENPPVLSTSGPGEREVLTPAAAGDNAALQEAAAIGRRLLEDARSECRRLAALATLGPEDEELPAALRMIIDRAGVDELAELTAMYRDQTIRRFGHARSSVESEIPVPIEPRLVSDTTLL